MGRVSPLEQIACTVLLVDDELDFLEVAADYLQFSGYKVLRAVDGLRALQHLAVHSTINILVTDIRMPGMNGVDLALKVRSLSPATRILFTSGSSAEIPSRNETLLEASTLLRKPYRLAELATAIESALRCTPSQPLPHA